MPEWLFWFLILFWPGPIGLGIFLAGLGVFLWGRSREIEARKS
jgi:hypothetical protein